MRVRSFLRLMALVATGCGSYKQADVASGDTGGESSCNVPIGQACTLVPICGCAPDENCGIAAGKFACTAAGTKRLYESCGAASDCIPGLFCETLTDGGTGICAAPCNTIDDCPKRVNEWACLKAADATSVGICEA